MHNLIFENTMIVGVLKQTFRETLSKRICLVSRQGPNCENCKLVSTKKPNFRNYGTQMITKQTL